MANEEIKVQLGIGVDATGAKAGFDQVKQAGQNMANAVKQAGQQAGKGVDQLGDSGEKAAGKMDRATRSMVNAIQRATAEVQTFGKGASDRLEALAGLRGLDTKVLKPYIDGLREAEKAAQAAQNGLNNIGMSAKQTQQALRGVPAQFTDIVSSLASGQAPLTVLLQQGGQLKDMFGGIGAAARALGGYIVGLASPFTLLAAAAGVLAFAYEKGQQEAEGYKKALILSGNAAGATAGQLQLMAQSMAQVQGTQGQAAEALAQFVTSGQVGAENLQQFAQAALAFQRATGTAISDTVKKFDELRKAPLDASLKLNEGMNYLTESIYKQIKALQDQGKTVEAADVAQKAFADTLKTRSAEMLGNIGLLERAWKGVKDAVSGAADAILSVGRRPEDAAAVADAQARVAYLEDQIKSRKSRGLATGGLDEQLAATKAQLDSLQEVARLSKRVADNRADEAQRVKDIAEFDKTKEQYLSKQVLLERELAKIREQGRKAGSSPQEMAMLEAEVRKKYKDTTAIELMKAQRDLEVEQIRKDGARITQAYAESEKIMESVRANGVLSEAEYYAAKRQFINLEGEAQEKALQEEIARLNRYAFTGKEKLENDRKIVDAQAKLDQTRLERTTRLEVLANQEVGAMNKIATAYLQAQQAAESYVTTLRRTNTQQFLRGGMTDVQAERQAGLDPINNKLADDLRALENKRAQQIATGTFNKDAQDLYAEQVRLAREAWDQALTDANAYYDALEQRRNDWAKGAELGLKNYADQSRNAFELSKQAAVNAFKAMEDAIVQFAMTGKLDFKSFADSVISDLIRIRVRKEITGPLAAATSGSFSDLTSGVGSFFKNLLGFDGGGYTGSGARAGGIDGKGGFLAVMHPQETVIDHTRGQSGGVTIVQNISVDSRSDQASIMAAMAAAKDAALAEIQNSRMRGGAFA